MPSIDLNAASIKAPFNAVRGTLPANFGRRLLWSLPLMLLAGACLFGFVATFEPMPRVARWSWRAVCLSAGMGSVLVIGWLWLKPRRQR